MIKTFKTKYYKGKPIYYRFWDNQHWTWEYLTIIDDEIYTAHANLRPQLWRRIIYRLFGSQTDTYFKLLFTPHQLNGCLNFMEKMAETTIDTVLVRKEQQAKKVAEKVIKDKK
jgi:hypothetical protein